MSKQPQSKKSTKPKKKSGVSIPVGIAHITATFNNTKIVITDPAGRVLCWSTPGVAKYSGARKSSAFAATVAGQQAGKKAAEFGVRDVTVKIKGPGAGRESAVRGLQSAGLNITAIEDVTPVPHNGCRAKKRRRV
ncbi:MAG: 30S ribosomal protein S11 [Chlamydiales bacterium]